MKMNYGALNALSEALNRMSGLTGRAGFAIARTKRSIRSEVEVFGELRDNLVRKYGKKKENGAISIAPGDERWGEFLAEFQELFVRETEVELYQLSKDEFDPDGIYCESAKADDYELFEAMMVKAEEKEEQEEQEEQKGEGE